MKPQKISVERIAQIEEQRFSKFELSWVPELLNHIAALDSEIIHWQHFDRKAELLTENSKLRAENERLKFQCGSLVVPPGTLLGWGHSGPCNPGCTCDLAKQTVPE